MEPVFSSYYDNSRMRSVYVLTDRKRTVVRYLSDLDRMASVLPQHDLYQAIINEMREELGTPGGVQSSMTETESPTATTYTQAVFGRPRRKRYRG